MMTYCGYESRSRLVDVVEAYTQRFGEPPTLIVVPATYLLSLEVEGVEVQTSSKISVILATHETTQFELPHVEQVYRSRVGEQQAEPSGQTDVTPIHIPLALTRPVGHPKKITGKCPHCGGSITDFSHLGWWWGWDKGIFPDYWPALHSFVVRRDGYRCQRCWSHLPAEELQAHHRKPKGIGGADSSRNLVTLCTKCHSYIHAHCDELNDQDALLLTT